MKRFSVWRHRFNLARLGVSEGMSVPKVSKKEGKRPFKVSVEGNIGSGKSTFLKHFEQFPFVETYGEPLEKWRNLHGHNFLDLLYSDMKTYSGSFQSYVQLTRTQLQLITPREGIQIQMFERSVQSNRYCFLENAHDSGNILPVQYTVLREWFEWLQENVDISLDLIVYLRTSPEVVHKRVLHRNRKEETGISIEYLESLHLAHEKWLLNSNTIIPVITIDANKQVDEIIKTCQNKVPMLFEQGISTTLLKDV